MTAREGSEMTKDERHEAFLQGLREAASIAATRGNDVLPASEIYEAIMARVRFEESKEDST